MRQILQSLKTGSVELSSIPVPACGEGRVLVKTNCSVVSIGTERMLVDFGKANLVNKARQQPDKVRMVLQKIKTDGIKPTLETVLNKLDQPLPLGYCNMGTVIEVGKGVEGFRQGDRVVTNGKHAEVVGVPKNLCVKVPDAVSDEAAAFTVLGSIALQGIRLANPTLGETVVVTGLGLVGLLTVQLLLANGCRVIGFDFDAAKVDLARNLGADAVKISSTKDPIASAEMFSRGRGVDAVIITASTNSSDPIHQAAVMCRKRGRIVLVGVTGLELSRADFFEKELSFQVSCSYGPGRYDPNYEEKGQDYPVGFVRWTEQRNFEAVLDMMADKRLDIAPLVSHRFSINDAEKAYELFSSAEPALGVLLHYSEDNLDSQANLVILEGDTDSLRTNKTSVSFIGAGNYASAVLIPAFKSTNVRLRVISCREGVSGVHFGKKFGFEQVTTDTQKIFQDEGTSAVVITTRHHNHAEYVISALDSGKHVFVEKPLCLSEQELRKIETCYNALEQKPILTVGFNRRFAPQIQKIKSLLIEVDEPKSFVMTVNAGAIPADHWTQDLEIGGGRLIGEACHFIDLLRFLAGAPIKNYGRVSLNAETDDTFSIIMSFADGSIGTLNYFANGPKSLSKERLEVFAGGGFLELDNFKKLRGKDWPGFNKLNLISQDKGQNSCANAFINATEGKAEIPIPVSEIFEVTRVCCALAKESV